MENIKGKVVAITGASSGIGEAIARHLSALGAHVVLGARREDRLEQIAKELSNSDSQVIYKKLDVTDPENVKAFVAHTLEEFNTLDVFVNNAGIMPLSMINAYKI